VSSVQLLEADSFTFTDLGEEGVVFVPRCIDLRCPRLMSSRRS
jgi:hypothetical protein